MSRIAWEPTRFPGVETKTLYWSPDGCVLLAIFDRPNEFLP